MSLILAADDPRHGTTRGYSNGCRCGGCRGARALDERRRRKMLQLYGTRRRIDATGTQRRIRALMALGWTSRHIADLCGWTSAEAVTEINKDRRFVYLATAEKIADAYERLCMTPGPSPQTKARAARKGWPPPLAWDDDRIDDPTYHPIDWRYASDDRAEALADFDHLRMGVTEVCRRLDLRKDSLEKWCERHGMREMYERMCARETPPVERRNQFSREAS